MPREHNKSVKPRSSVKRSQGELQLNRRVNGPCLQFLLLYRGSTREV